MHRIENATSFLKFKITSEPNVKALQISSDLLTNCYSTLGYSPTHNRINLGKGCFYAGEVVHLILHALGLGHENNRADSKDYLTSNTTALIEDISDSDEDEEIDETDEE
jgi:hypothetical protein